MVVADLRGTDISNGTSSDTRKPERRARTGHTLRAGEISTTPPKCIGTFSKHRGRVSRGTSSASATIRHVAAIKGKFRIGGILWRFPRSAPKLFPRPRKYSHISALFCRDGPSPETQHRSALTKRSCNAVFSFLQTPRRGAKLSLSVKADRASLFPKLSRPRR